MVDSTHPELSSFPEVAAAYLLLKGIELIKGNHGGGILKGKIQVLSVT